ncbi:MAG: ATP-dependent helicase HrpB, partial [Alphaproteobacteria bacterium]|nr:ATP-dependent helicase HrpB [Alphaproteobacteria bacterium]
MNHFKNLPISNILADIQSTLNTRSKLVIQAPPGAGKTTSVPLFMLGLDWSKGKKIIMLEPRRIAARAAAQFMAASLNEDVGQTVGYRVQLDTCVSAQTRLEIVTEGILTRMIQSDPELSDVAAIIFDEFHERNLNGDLGLALALDCQEAFNEELKIIVMSATLDGEKISKLLDNAPIITSEGRSFEVTPVYLGEPITGRNARNKREALLASLQAAISSALAQDTGSILVFVAGEFEIRALEKDLRGRRLPDNVDIRPLFGALTLSEQRNAIAPSPEGRRKIVLATNIAETSLTIDGISIVIDSGYHRKAAYNPSNGLTTLETKRISLASATQRMGRAGRLGPGKCYKLWDRNQEGGFQPYEAPEITTSNLSDLALQLASWGCQDPKDLRWIDMPPPGLFEQAKEELRTLELINSDGSLTILGKHAVNLPVSARLSKMLLVGVVLGREDEACNLAALLSERDFLSFESQSDILLRYEKLKKGDAPKKISVFSKMLKKRLAKLPHSEIRNTTFANSLRSHESKLQFLPDLIGTLLSFAYPDRIALTRNKGGTQ